MKLPYLRSNLSQKICPLNRVAKVKCASYGISWFLGDFQKACPRKCCGHFQANSIQLKYSRCTTKWWSYSICAQFYLKKFDLWTGSQKWNAQLWDIMILSHFQKACPRKCCGHFWANSTQVKYICVLLQINEVTASVLKSISKNLTSEQGRKSEMWDITSGLGHVEGFSKVKEKDDTLIKIYANEFLST